MLPVGNNVNVDDNFVATGKYNKSNQQDNHLFEEKTKKSKIQVIRK